MARLPYSLKVLLENLLRNEDGESVTKETIESVAKWVASDEPSIEIAYSPSRVLMQDFTGVPAIVDLAAMRDAMEELGGDPTKINPLVPVELVIDHSIQVDSFAEKMAFKKNAELEFERNQERYAFLRWGQTAFDNFSVVPPNTGICHQVNLEYLSQRGHRPRRPGVPRHAGGHRLAHHDGQRPRRAGLGRGRHRGRGRHAGPAGVDAAAAGGRLPDGRRAARGRHRHRPGAHRDPDAARARRGGQVRGVLRPRPAQHAAGRPGHDRQHEPRVRLHLRDLPGRRRDAALHGVHRPPDRAAGAGRGLRPRAGHVPRRGRRGRRSTRTRWSWTWPRSCRRLAGPKRPQDRISLSNAAQRLPGRAGGRSNDGKDDRPRRQRRAPDASRPATRPPPMAGQEDDEDDGEPAHQHGDVATRGAEEERQGLLRRPGVRPRGRRRGHRRHHLVHQHLEPRGHARRRPAGPQRGREGPDQQAVGQDLAGARVQGGHGLLRARRPDRAAERARLRPGGLRLHHLHRQLRPAAGRDLQGRRGRRT